jgi:hypothetical protein
VALNGEFAYFAPSPLEVVEHILRSRPGDEHLRSKRGDPKSPRGPRIQHAGRRRAAGKRPVC